MFDTIEFLRRRDSDSGYSQVLSIRIPPLKGEMF